MASFLHITVTHEPNISNIEIQIYPFEPVIDSNFRALVYQW